MDLSKTFPPIFRYPPLDFSRFQTILSQEGMNGILRNQKLRIHPRRIKNGKPLIDSANRSGDFRQNHDPGEADIL